MFNFDQQIQVFVNDENFRENCRFRERTDVNRRQEMHIRDLGHTIYYGGKCNMGHDNSRFQTNMSIPIKKNSVYYFEV